MNPSDLLVVIAIGAGLYAILVSLTKQKQFLLKAVNPNRITWLLAGISVLWVGLSLMRIEAQSWNLEVWSTLLQQLITDAPTPPRVKIAAIAIFFSTLLILLVLWCVLVFPRDPTTFRFPGQRASALRHYVRQKGGLDFALLSWGNGEVIHEQVDARKIESWCRYLPMIVPPGQSPRHRTLQEQLDNWRQSARNIHGEKQTLDRMLSRANQGGNRRFVFDCDYGGLFFWYLRPPDSASPVENGLFLFGATLNQGEMSNGRAEQRFQMLYQALQNIENSVRIQ